MHDWHGFCHAVSVAQWIARRTSNPEAVGSSPTGDADIFLVITCDNDNHDVISLTDTNKFVHSVQNIGKLALGQGLGKAVYKSKVSPSEARGVTNRHPWGLFKIDKST